MTDHLMSTPAAVRGSALYGRVGEILGLGRLTLSSQRIDGDRLEQKQSDRYRPVSSPQYSRQLASLRFQPSNFSPLPGAPAPESDGSSSNNCAPHQSADK